jgi:hypothetical protein
MAGRLVDAVARALEDAGAVSKATALFTNQVVQLLDREEIDVGRDRAAELLLQLVKNNAVSADKKIGRFSVQRGVVTSLKWYVY